MKLQLMILSLIVSKSQQMSQTTMISVFLDDCSISHNFVAIHNFTCALLSIWKFILIYNMDSRDITVVKALDLHVANTGWIPAPHMVLQGPLEVILSTSRYGP